MVCCSYKQIYTFYKVSCTGSGDTDPVCTLCYTSQLRIGVAKDGRERLKAHAWVESQGKIVIGNVQDLSRFKALPTLEAIKF